jgi:hypothetical protein
MRATNGFGPKWGFAVQFNSTAAVIAADSACSATRSNGPRDLFRLQYPTGCAGYNRRAGAVVE